jgi:uncharacterized protein YecE (DUF72 family)
MHTLIGTAGWTDKTLIESGWYPPDAKSAEKRLRHYAGQFPLVEVDSTYYFPPSEQNSKLWVERTPAGFTFNIKAFSLLTQHPTKRKALYKDLQTPDKKNLYLDDLDRKTIDEVWDRFLSALQPLADAGKLGLLLFQFPPWFVISRKNKHYILESAKRAAPSPSTAKASRTSVKDLEGFLTSRSGVEAFLEPRTAVYATTLLLVAADGEYLRRPIDDRTQATDLCGRHNVPLYDAAKVGYPRRMRDYDRGIRRDHVDLSQLPPWPGEDVEERA